MFKIEFHQNALLRSHRCSWCAERVSEFLILRQADCPKCGLTLEWQTAIDAPTLQEVIKGRWTRHRWVILTALAIASVTGGQIPMLQGLLFIIALLVGHWMLIRRPLRWLPPARRVCAKLSIQLAGLLVSMLMLILNALVAPFLFFDGFVLAIFSVLNMALYVHFSFFIIERRLNWEISGRPFGIQDWILPVATTTSLVISAVAVGFGAYWTVDWLSRIQFPGADDFAAWLERMGSS